MSVASDVDRFMRHVFTSITVNGPALDATEFQRRPHMVVCTHRSHVDYFLGGYVLLQKGFKYLRFAAGNNLTGLPYIGQRFRAFGAFTVEREIAFERNYVKNLCSRVMTMMEHREAVIVFPEGGRSYTGKTLDIKSGILGAAVLLQARLPAEEISLLPMAISYERPPDARYFSLLLAGKRLRKRTQPLVKRMLGAAFYFGADLLAFAPFATARRTGLRYGEAFVDYGKPITVGSLIDIHNNKQAGAKDEFFAHRASMRELGEIVRGRFISLYRLLPQHLLAWALKEGAPLSLDQAARRIASRLDALRSDGRNVAAFDSRPLPAMVERGAKELHRLGAVGMRGDSLSVKRRALLDYYAAPVLDKR